MATEKLTTNCSNWSGEEITVEVDRENLSWEQFGYQFNLKWIDYPEDLHNLLGKGYYEIHGEGWGDSLGQIGVEEGKDAIAFNGGIDRDAKDPIEAAVKLLCNII